MGEYQLVNQSTGVRPGSKGSESNWKEGGKSKNLDTTDASRQI